MIDTGGLTCVVNRTLNAPVEAVYRAWSDAKMAARWSWGPEFDTVSVELDCRAGGEWRQHIRNRETGENWFFDGVFREVVPLNKLVHTFHFKSDRGADEPESLVTVEFTPRGERTEVVITHTELSATKLSETEHGWGACLDCIERCSTVGLG